MARVHKTLTANISPEAYDALERISRGRGVSKAKALEQIVLWYAEEHGYTDEPEDPERAKRLQELHQRYVERVQQLGE